MKRFVLIIFVGMLALGFSSQAFSLTLLSIDEDRLEAVPNENLYSTFTNSGQFLGAFEGNDSNQLFGDSGLEVWLEQTLHLDPAFQITEYFKDEDYEDDGATTSGEWSTDADIMFYVVKTTDAFAIYRVTPLASSGTWSTYDLWIHGQGSDSINKDQQGNILIDGIGPTISHITGYNAAPVPEPATLLLLGTGLVGLAGIGRKRMKKIS